MPPRSVGKARSAPPLHIGLRACNARVSLLSTRIPPVTRSSGMSRTTVHGVGSPANEQHYFANGATGDGVTDDSDAINRAISEGDRCGPWVCQSSTDSPAVVYFPSGTYLIGKPIVMYYSKCSNISILLSRSTSFLLLYIVHVGSTMRRPAIRTNPVLDPSKEYADTLL